MRIDLNCPVEAVGTELIREETGWIRLNLMNLTDREIDSCEATVRILDREGKETGRAVHRARALKGRPHSAFAMMIPTELGEDAAGAEATLDKVWFEDHDVWRRNPAKEKEYEPNQLPPGNELNALRYVAGNGAVGFPSQQAEIWVCVCGRPNSNSEVQCARCRRSREMIFQQYQRGAVLRQVSLRERQLDLQTRGAREEAARLQREREEEYDRRQTVKRRRRRLGIALACALALAAVCFWGLAPAARLWSAREALREERLEDARETLAELGGFPGAQAGLAEAEQRITRRDGEAAAGTDAFSPGQMAEISAALREKGNGDTDLALADRVDLSRARSLLNGGNPEEAESLALSLPEMPGRDELVRECAYARAENAFAARDYEKARELFEGLGDYPGAAERARASVYEPALAQMEAGEYDAAIAALSRIPDYQDSGKLILQCRYLKGLTLEAQGEDEAAREAYLAAGEYEDAAERAQAIRWRQAEALLAAEDYAAALPLYREMDGTQDAREKWIQCATALAQTAYRQREYLQAVSYLEDLPEDTRTTRQIRTRGLYLGAKAAANRGELEEAIGLMERVITYSDAERNVRNWRIALARERMEAERYEEAKEILQPIAENYNAQKLLQEIEKEMTPEGGADEQTMDSGA